MTALPFDFAAIFPLSSTLTTLELLEIKSTSLRLDPSGNIFTFKVSLLPALYVRAFFSKLILITADLPLFESDTSFEANTPTGMKLKTIINTVNNEINLFFINNSPILD